ncbi:MAG: DUF2203 domain-containing protein [Acidobacteriaceae bacterium]|nr:DUF2203 domain-containing protein [Acidobacteriaceae bacterium]
MPRFFTLSEAESLLPEVRRLLDTLITSKNDYEESSAEIDGIKQRIALLGGVTGPGDRAVQLRARKDNSARALKSSFERIEEIGCQIKDLDTGLVDFPTLYHDQEVYLCWKLGEPTISYWHHVSDGFAGRRAIDSEFLAHHRAD